MSDIQLTSEDREKFIRLCQAAHAAIIIGNHNDAHTYFRYAAQIHPRSTTVWLGLAKIVSSPADKRVALENVLAINPHHKEALQLLEIFNTDT